MDISFGELLVIALLAFLVLGPKELVRLSHQLGKVVGKLKREFEHWKILSNEKIETEKKTKVEKTSPQVTASASVSVEDPLNHG